MKYFDLLLSIAGTLLFLGKYIATRFQLSETVRKYSPEKRKTKEKESRMLLIFFLILLVKALIGFVS